MCVCVFITEPSVCRRHQRVRRCHVSGARDPDDRLPRHVTDGNASSPIATNTFSLTLFCLSSFPARLICNVQSPVAQIREANKLKFSIPQKGTIQSPSATNPSHVPTAQADIRQPISGFRFSLSLNLVRIALVSGHDPVLVHFLLEKETNPRCHETCVTVCAPAPRLTLPRLPCSAPSSG